MTLHTHLPIYRKGCDLVSLAYDVQKEMPRHFKRTLGEKIVALCMDMLDLMAEANANKGHERADCIRRLLKCQHRATVLLRVSHEKRCISHKVWAQSVQLLDNIGKQGGGWLKKSANAKAPAA